MTVIDAARQLGAVVQTDPRYIEYVKAKTMNDADEELQKLIGDFNLIRQNLTMETNKEPEEANGEKIKELNLKMQEAYEKEKAERAEKDEQAKAEAEAQRKAREAEEKVKRKGSAGEPRKGGKRPARPDAKKTDKDGK